MDKQKDTQQEQSQENEENIDFTPCKLEWQMEDVMIENDNTTNSVETIQFAFIYKEEGMKIRTNIQMCLNYKQHFYVECYINNDKMTLANKTETTAVINNENYEIKKLLQIINTYKNNDEIALLAVQCLFIVLYHNYDIYSNSEIYNKQCDSIQYALLDDWENKLKKFKENMQKKIDEEEEKKQDEIQEYNNDCCCWKYSKNHITENEIIIQHQMNTNECNNNPVTTNIDVYNGANGNNITVGNGSLRSSVFE